MEPNAKDDYSTLVRKYRKLDDSVEKIRFAAQAMDNLRWQMSQFAQMRHAATHELVSEIGATEAGRRLGVSRQQVYRLISEPEAVAER